VTPRNFWADSPPKSGVAPARSRAFSCVTFLILVSFISSFSRDLCASQGEEDGEDEVEVGNSYLLHLLRANSRRAHRKKFLAGLERPTTHFGHGTVCKSGVAPAHSGGLPASKLSVAPCPISMLPAISPHRWVTQTVTDRVTYVFHVSVTFPLQKRPLNLISIFAPLPLQRPQNQNM
jgi:hypothetical protein